MKRIAIGNLWLLFFISVPYSLASGQSAKDALMALKKLEARCEAGISYRDYANASCEG